MIVTMTSSTRLMKGTKSGMRSMGETMYATAIPKIAFLDQGTRPSIASS